jgi:hypothetical protein
MRDGNIFVILAEVLNPHLNRRSFRLGRNSYEGNAVVFDDIDDFVDRRPNVIALAGSGYMLSFVCRFIDLICNAHLVGASQVPRSNLLSR